MFLSPKVGGKVAFAITRSGYHGERVIVGEAPLPIRQWVHVAVSINGPAGTLYVNGEAVGKSTDIVFSPQWLGTTTRNYIRKSQFQGDPYLDG